MTDFDALIVGAGHGGAQAAIALRQQGFAGSIAIVGDEPELPYERPPLSKDYLAGEKTFERLLIRPAAFWEQREVAMLLGRRVTAVDPEAHRVTLSDGATLGYGKLIWATGGRARILSCEGADLAGVHTVRSRADVERMLAELPAVQRAVVIGGGYIGLEAAAVLTKLGKQVTVLEALDRVLARVAGEPISRFYEAEHRAHGVDLRTGVTVESIVGENGRATGVRLALPLDGGGLGEGERLHALGGSQPFTPPPTPPHQGEGSDRQNVIPAEMAIIGIGVVPAVEPLIAAGAAGGNGVEVDEYCRTTLPDIYAVGDCAAHTNRFAAGARVRLESVQNANDQATTAAKGIAGAPQPYDAVPWFWSNQYDLRLQTVGLQNGHDQCIVRGDPASRSFSTVYLRDGRVIALDCVNSVKDYVQAKALVMAGAAAPPDQLADPAVALKSLAG